MTTIMNFSRQKLRVAVIRLSALLIGVQFAYGSGAPSETGDTSPSQARLPDSLELTEIIVTAQKRKMNPHSVPAGLTVLNTRDIQEAGIYSTEAIDRYVPNFSSYHCHDFFSFYSIRGQSNLVNSSNAVGIYIDDVPVSIGSNRTTSRIYGLERIEVLRGPQGNLYGLNSSGGIVNIVTKQPDNDLTNMIGAGYGSYAAQKYNIAASGPIVKDRLFLGCDGMYMIRDSYIEERGHPGRQTSFGCGRIRLRSTPVDRMDIVVTADISEHEADFNDWTVIDDTPYIIENKGIDENVNQSIDMESFKINYEFNKFKITSVTSRVNRAFEGMGGNDFISGNNMSYSAKKENSFGYLEEVRLNSTDTQGSFKWLAGSFLFYGKDEGAFSQYVDKDSPKGDYFVKTGNSSILKKTVVSFFGECGYTIANRLTLNCGIRYDRDEKEIECSCKTGSAVGFFGDKSVWESTSPRFALDYKVNNNLMTYANAARGSKAGGYSTFSNAVTAEDNRFDPEYVWSYEAGIKGRCFGNKLYGNLALFYSSIDDLQTMSINPANNSQVYGNAAAAQTYGAEMELGIRRLVPNLELSFSLGLIRSEIVEHDIEKYEGNSIPLAPEYQSEIRIRYSFGNGFFIRSGYYRHGKTYHNEFNDHFQDSYGIVSLGIGYSGKLLSLNVYADNMLGEKYYTFTRNAGKIDLGVPGTPREIGMKISVEY